MIDSTVVELSRWQFAVTALYHYLFVPLTLGLSFFIAAVETVYVTTGRAIYREMAQFWSKLFVINMALGIATGLTMEFEFGTNWSFYSGFVGDIFGAPLAIEGLMAFFMESTFVGLMIFGWKRLTKVQHLLVTYLVAFGTNLSALWILIANSFMQNPVGAKFNPVTMRMELASFSELIFSHDAQAKFVHTSIAGYVTAAIFVTGISAYYMYRRRHMAMARRSFRMAALFGVLATAGVITLGDALGFVGGQAQPSKLAAMEAMWETAPAPAPFNVIAWPSQDEKRNRFELQVPYVLTPLLTHTMTQEVPGVDRIEADAARRIANGIPAVAALKVLSGDPTKVGASSSGTATRDGAVAKQLAALTGTETTYRALVVKLGVESQTATRRVEIQAGITDQIDTAREASSGVDVDEEMTNMLMFQHAYDAAARLLSTMDGNLDTLINHMGAGR